MCILLNSRNHLPIRGTCCWKEKTRIREEEQRYALMFFYTIVGIGGHVIQRLSFEPLAKQRLQDSEALKTTIMVPATIQNSDCVTRATFGNSDCLWSNRFIKSDCK